MCTDYIGGIAHTEGSELDNIVTAKVTKFQAPYIASLISLCGMTFCCHVGVRNKTNTSMFNLL